MAWITPKTNWVSTDYVNVSDINRIKNNILYLYDYASSVFNIYSYNIPDLGPDLEYSSLFYASFMNKIENALQDINSSTFNYRYKISYWFPNQSTPTYIDYNRIETMIQKIYDALTSRRETIVSLSFVIGRQRGIK